MSSQFDVQPMIGAFKSQGAWAEVWEASVKVWCCVEGWMEKLIGIKFGGICGDCKVCYPPSSVFSLEIFFKVFGCAV